MNPDTTTIVPRVHRRPGGTGPLATSLVFKFLRPGGGAEVVIDSRRRLFLSPRPAALLEILADDRAAERDGVVNWKPLDAVEVALGLTPGMQSADRTISSMVWRIRSAATRQAGLPFRFIERDRRRGLRAAVKSRHAPPA